MKRGPTLHAVDSLFRRFTDADVYGTGFVKQEAFEKCWAHSLSASRRYIVSHQVSLVARQL